jgi:hypothetical protein
MNRPLTPALVSTLRTATASFCSRPAKPLLATTIAGEWVFWQNGAIDFLMFTLASKQMAVVILAGWILIVLAAVILVWRKRRVH